MKKCDVVNFTISYDGDIKNDFRPKVEKYFAAIIKYCPYLLHYHLEINTKNTFPHSSGIASSASGMSALSLCLMSFEKEISKEEFSRDFFFLKHLFYLELDQEARVEVSMGALIYGGNIKILNKVLTYFHYKLINLFRLNLKIFKILFYL